MQWNEYREKVNSSREVIVFPFFKKSLACENGIGIDIGCGDGDLTSEVAKSNSSIVVGIDADLININGARASDINTSHFVKGDVAKNAISMTGVSFDFAYSNCCFTHLSDEDVFHVFVDLHSCLKEHGKFVFLVPNWLWAKEMYSDIENISNGITAVPRYGGKQIFRMPEWYIETLNKCGFEIESCYSIPIPNSKRLDARYQENAGKLLFSAFIARKKSFPSENHSLEKAFNIAHENRKFEIELFWKRSLFYWGFIATALVGYGAAKNSGSNLSFVFSLFGVVCSFIWSAGNRGSKYWQEYWEDKVNLLQYYVTGNIFFDRKEKISKGYDQFSPRRISVSKLTIALSDFVVMLWLLLTSLEIFSHFFTIQEKWYGYIALVLSALTAIYIFSFIKRSNSED